MDNTEATTWPISVTPEQTLRTLLRNCTVPAGPRSPGRRPRWSVVSDLTTHGSNYAAMLCRWADLDPNEIVVQRK